MNWKITHKNDAAEKREEMMVYGNVVITEFWTHVVSKYI
jgi:hypothetical protein